LFVQGLDEHFHYDRVFDSQPSKKFEELILVQFVTCMEVVDTQALPDYKFTVELQIFAEIKVCSISDVHSLVIGIEEAHFPWLDPFFLMIMNFVRALKHH
jgi:hypothetical protein